MFAPCEEIPHVSPSHPSEPSLAGDPDAGRDVGHPALVICTHNSGVLQQLVEENESVQRAAIKPGFT